MPLSDHEQRLLDQIERALYAEDPKFASTVRATDLRSHLRRRVQRGVALFVVGFGLLLAGVITKIVFVGVIGFVVMLLAALVALTSWRRLGLRSEVTGRRSTPRRFDPGGASSPRQPGGSHPTKPAKGSFMRRLEERWRRRWEDRGR